MEGQDRLEEDI